MEVVIIKAHDCKDIIKNSLEETERSVQEIFRNAVNDERESGEEGYLHIVVLANFDTIFGVYEEASQHKEIVKKYIMDLVDGESRLNNILIIGIADKLENIENDNLRAGRFEVQIESGV